MKMALKIFLFSVFVPLFVHPDLADANLVEMAKKIQPAVVTVITYNKDKKAAGIGSGFFIDKKGHLITNYHVLTGAFSAEIKTFDGKKYPVKTIVAEDRVVDLAKVLVEIPAESHSWIKISGTPPDIGEPVFVIGSPKGLEQTVSEGIVSSVRDLSDSRDMIQITASISSGSSGSPVMNMTGDVIGVATLYILGGQNLNFAVPAEHVLNLKQMKKGMTLSKWTAAVVKKAEEWSERGDSLFKPGTYDEAIKAYTAALELCPDYGEALLNRALVWQVMGEEDRAIDGLTSLLGAEKNEHTFKAHFWRGRLLMEKKEYDLAIADFTSVLEMQPYGHAIYALRGSCLMQKGVSVMEEAMSMRERREKEGLHDDTFLDIARDQAKEYFERAIADWKKALTLEPDSKKYKDGVDSLEELIKNLGQQKRVLREGPTP